MRLAFDIFKGDTKKLVGCQQVKFHVIWYVKLADNFSRKYIFVAVGHTTNALSVLTYSLLVTRDFVCAALIIASLNRIDILACDI